MSKEELNLDYKKALEVFKDTMREGNYLLAVKSALEKQIPKKPTKRYCNANDYYYCSACGGCLGENNEYDLIQGNYCHRCGQALDWSDTE